MARCGRIYATRRRQVVVDGAKSTTISSDINLVDLAGSERADTSGSTGATVAHSQHM